MAKRLSREEKNGQAIIDLINEMFRIAGHAVTYEDVKDRQDDWFQQWTMTEAQYDEWKAWGKKYIMKNLRMHANVAEGQMTYVGLMWGLKFDKAPGTPNTEVQ